MNKSSIWLLSLLIAVLSVLWTSHSYRTTGSAKEHSPVAGNPKLHNSAGHSGQELAQDLTLVSLERNQEVRKLLGDLSELARSVESGAVGFDKQRREKGLPDSLMWRLRVLAHTDARMLPLVLEYLQSEKEPEAARMMVLIALAQPREKGIIEMLSQFIDGASNSRLVALACGGFDVKATRGICSAWPHLFWALQKTSPAYFQGGTIPGAAFVFQPADAAHYPEVNKAVATGDSQGPILTALLSFLERSGNNDEKSAIMSCGRRMLDRIPESQTQRERLHGVAEVAYVQGDQGWQAAVDILTDGRHGGTARDLDILSQGLDRLSHRQLGIVLNEVSRISAERAFTPPFVSYLDNYIQHAASAGNQGGPQDGEFSGLLARLITRPAEQGGRGDLLLNHPSDVLRTRAATALRSSALRNEQEAKLAISFCESLLTDKTLRVRVAAGRSLFRVLSSNSSLPLSAERIFDSRKNLLEWATAEAHNKDVSSQDLAYIQEIIDATSGVNR